MTDLLAPIPDHEFDAWAAAHLLRRAGFGGSMKEAEQLQALGLDAAVDQLTGFPDAPAETPACGSPPPESASEFRERLAKLDPEEREPENRERRQTEQNNLKELQWWWLRRMLEGGHPLQEKLTLFWHSHFASAFGDKIDAVHPLFAQNNTLRRLAAAPFPDLLRAIIRDPAMLVWLDNADSHRERPNENFARELMELFSLGVNQYSEEDVRQSALALTGYSVDRDRWNFVFREDRHDPGVKTYLGMRGVRDGEDVAAAICMQPAMPRFISRKLLDFFVRHDPPENWCILAAELYARSRFDLRAFLRVLFRSRMFYSARCCLVKSPVELVIGSLKALRIPLPRRDVVLDSLRTMGQELFVPPDVNGWPGGSTWINSNLLLVRYNFSNYLVHGVSPDDFRTPDPEMSGSELRRFVESQRSPDAPDWSPARLLNAEGLASRLDSAQAVANYYSRELLGRPVPRETGELFAGFMETDASGGKRTLRMADRSFDERVKGLVHLILSSPDFQLG